MVGKCANPACSTRFLRLRDGRLFVKEVPADSTGYGSGHFLQLRYFWLCDSCCRTMIVIVEEGGEVKVAPLSPTATTARAAS